MNEKEIVHAWHTLWRNDPLKANELYLHKDIKILLPGLNAIKGWEKANEHFQEVASAVSLPQPYTPEENEYVMYFTDGDKVARRFRCIYNNKDGTTMDMMVFNIYVIKEGKIIYFEEYYDSQYMKDKSDEEKLKTRQYEPEEYMRQNAI